MPSRTGCQTRLEQADNDLLPESVDPPERLEHRHGAALDLQRGYIQFGLQTHLQALDPVRVAEQALLADRSQRCDLHLFSVRYGKLISQDLQGSLRQHDVTLVTGFSSDLVRWAVRGNLDRVLFIRVQSPRCRRTQRDHSNSHGDKAKVELLIYRFDIADSFAVLLFKSSSKAEPSVRLLSRWSPRCLQSAPAVGQ